MTTQAIATAAGGVVLSGSSSANVSAIMASLANGEFIAASALSGIVNFTATGVEILGEDWSIVAEGDETWSVASEGTEVWTVVSEGGESWTQVSEGNETWSVVSEGNENWNRQ
jgi:hypothetical protein